MSGNGKVIEERLSL